jgi:hypothetical protein
MTAAHEKKSELAKQINNQINFVRQLRTQAEELAFDRMTPPSFPPPPLPSNTQ